MNALRLTPKQDIYGPIGTPAYLNYPRDRIFMRGPVIMAALGLHAGLGLALYGLLAWQHLPAPPDEPIVALVMQKSPTVGTGPQVLTPVAMHHPPQPQTTMALPVPATPSKAPLAPADAHETSPVMAQAVKLAALPMPASPAPPPPQPAATPKAAAPKFTPLRNVGDNQPVGSGLVVGARIIPARPNSPSNQPPSYPQEAMLNGEEGKVLLTIHVLPNGHPNWIDVKTSSGFKVLDKAAKDAVMRWQFLPAQLGGKPVPSVLPFWISFQLN